MSLVLVRLAGTAAILNRQRSPPRAIMNLDVAPIVTNVPPRALPPEGRSESSCGGAAKVNSKVLLLKFWDANINKARPCVAGGERH